MLACNYSGYFECSFDQETQRGMETEKKILGKGLKKLCSNHIEVAQGGVSSRARHN